MDVAETMVVSGRTRLARLSQVAAPAGEGAVVDATSAAARLRRSMGRRVMGSVSFHSEGHS